MGNLLNSIHYTVSLCSVNVYRMFSFILILSDFVQPP